jgi:ATP-dependent Lon protease
MGSKKGDKQKYNTRSQNKRRRNRDDSSDDSDENIILKMENSSDEYETVSESETDSSYNPPVKTKGDKQRIRKIIAESESSEDIEQTEDDDESSENDDDDDESVINPHELRKTIATLFPSNYINKKVKADERESKRSKKKRHSKKHKKRSRRYQSESDDDESEEYYEDDEEDEGNVEDFNILISALTGGGPSGPDASDKKAIEDDKDEECNSDDEKLFMKENYETISIPEIVKKDSEKKAKKEKKKKHRNKSENSETSETVDAETEYKDLIELKKQLSEKLAKRPNNKILLHAVQECRDSVRKLIKKSRMKNAKKYYKMVNGDEEPKTGEIEYFKKQLSNKEQLRVIKELNEINEHMNIKKPYRLTLLDSNIPPKYKATVMQKVNMLRSMEPGDPEYFKLKTWVDGFMRIPFSQYNNLDVNITDGIEKCSEFMENAKKTLDECVYGLNDAKMQIMQMIGQWITNPNALGTAIAIKGPPGTGKTSLVKEGISKILGREFAFIALGGTGDASFLEGHGYTYEGSMWGRIVQILMESKCMNPVIYFDELDKVSDTPRGEEIIGILTHLTDTTQNNQYHDKYFSEITFDLSKCLFIFSYNDESKINPILRDRMYRIMTKGYEAKEKLIIAKDFLLPKIREQVAFKEDELIIPDDTLSEIIKDETITLGEEGVRNLKRCLEVIHTKLNLFRLMKPEKNIFAKEIKLEITFPITVTNEHVKKLVDRDEPNQSFLQMYV